MSVRNLADRGLLAAIVALALFTSGARAATEDLLFTSNGGDGPEIYLAAAGEAGKRLTASRGGNEQPRWSPDGRRIAFVSYRDGNAEIYVMQPDGSNALRLTRHPGLDVEPQWSPDGRRIAFISNRSGLPRIWIMDADGSNTRAVVDTGTEQGLAQWSPDGTMLAFTAVQQRKGDVLVVNADGSGLRNLTATAKKSHSAPHWSPDGRRLAFTRSDGDTVSEIVVASLETGDLVSVTDTRSFLNFSPIWSPDGRRIAFLSTRDHPEGTRSNVFVMHADGSGVVNVARQPDTECTMVAWSADSARLFYVVVPWGSSQIHVAGVDGSGRRVISQQKGFDLDPQPCCTGKTSLPAVAKGP